jgi:hypothetical protein
MHNSHHKWRKHYFYCTCFAGSVLAKTCCTVILICSTGFAGLVLDVPKPYRKSIMMWHVLRDHSTSTCVAPSPTYCPLSCQLLCPLLCPSFGFLEIASRYHCTLRCLNDSSLPLPPTRLPSIWTRFFFDLIF